MKFLAYIKKYERIERVVDIDYKNKSVTVEIDFQEEGVRQCYEYGFDEIEIMESLGVRDYNGRSVYSGFILKLSSGRVGLVKYVPENLGFMLSTYIDGSICYMYLDETIVNHSTTIGNIYENPYLLDNKLGDA